jgi:hypothetical protein
MGSYLDARLAEGPLGDDQLAELEELTRRLPDGPWRPGGDETVYAADGQMIADLWDTRVGEWMVAVRAAVEPLVAELRQHRDTARGKQ